MSDRTSEGFFLSPECTDPELEGTSWGKRVEAARFVLHYTNLGC